MPTATYTPLANVTLGSTASSVTFSSIPATYRDLRLVINGTLSSVGGLGARLNLDSGTNYSYVQMRGNVSGGVSAARSSGGTGVDAIFLSESNLSSGSRFDMHIDYFDYNANDKHKTVIARNNYTDDGENTAVQQTAGRWANTAAVTSVRVICSSSFAAGSTFSLFGILS
jgi:hypothetical protein